ncbi:MAG: hypothetical protein RLZZ432_157 [Chloroflexota bacterium]
MHRIARLPLLLLRLLLVVALLPFLLDVPTAPSASAGDLLANGAAPGARRIDVDGTESVVAEAGRAGDPALLLVHGFGGSTFGWRTAMAPLAARGWHVIAIDLPGFGLSAKDWGRDYGHEAQARFALAVLDRLGVERAVLVGHSMGGNVVAWMAALAPERVAGLVLVDAAILSPAAGAPVADEGPAAALLAAPPLRRLGRIAIRSLFTADTFGTLLRSAFAVQGAATPQTVAGYAASARLERWDLALLGIVRDGGGNLLPRPIEEIVGTTPTLILWGAADSWVPLGRGEALRAVLPAARWVVLPGVGHVPFEEAPDAFEGALGDWLAPLR